MLVRQEHENASILAGQRTPHLGDRRLLVREDPRERAQLLCLDQCVQRELEALLATVDGDRQLDDLVQDETALREVQEPDAPTRSFVRAPVLDELIKSSSQDRELLLRVGRLVRLTPQQVRGVRLELRA